MVEIVKEHREDAAWFWAILVDADLESAGGGADKIDNRKEHCHATVDLLTTLEHQNPKSRYLDEGYAHYFVALIRTGGASNSKASEH